MNEQSMYLFSEQVILPSEHQKGKLEVTSALIEGQGSQIASVQRLEREEWQNKFSSESVHDFGRDILSPSFINGHTHLAMSSLRGLGQDALRGNVVEDLYFLVESHLEPEDVRAFVRMGAYENMLCGIGAVWDHYYHASEIANALKDIGLCGVVAPTVQDLSGPGQHQWEQAIETTLTIHEDSQLQQAGVYAALGPHATDTVSPKLWRQLLALAEKHHLVIHAHLAQSFEEYERSQRKFDCSTISGLNQAGVLDAPAGVVLVHSLFVTEEDIALLDPKRHVLAYCPLSQIQFAFPAHIAPWYRAGIPIQIGTDAGACNDTMNVQQELRVMAGGPSFGVTMGTVYQNFQRDGSLDNAKAVYDQRVHIFDQMPDNQDMLQMVWQTPGQLHSDLNMGVIRPGARACLSVWNAKHPALWPATDPIRALVMCDAAPALRNHMLNGKWLAPHDRNLQDYILNSTNFQAAQEEASERLDALLKRLHLV